MDPKHGAGRLTRVQDGESGAQLHFGLHSLKSVFRVHARRVPLGRSHHPEPVLVLAGQRGGGLRPVPCTEDQPHRAGPLRSASR